MRRGVLARRGTPRHSSRTSSGKHASISLVHFPCHAGAKSSQSCRNNLRTIIPRAIGEAWKHLSFEHSGSATAFLKRHAQGCLVWQMQKRSGNGNPVAPRSPAQPIS